MSAGLSIPSWNSDLDDPGAAQEVIERWGARHDHGEDPQLKDWAWMVERLSTTRPTLVGYAMNRAFRGKGACPLDGYSLSELATLLSRISLDEPQTHCLVQMIQRGGEKPTTLLLPMLRLALDPSLVKHPTSLKAYLEHIDPNAQLSRPHGRGNVLFHAITLTAQLHTSLTDLFREVATTLLACGANPQTPCQEYRGSADQATTYPSIMMWVGRDELSIQRWAQPVLDILLDLGCPWDDLDQRDDAVGRQVRAHCAWRRAKLCEFTTRADSASVRHKAL